MSSHEDAEQALLDAIVSAAKRSAGAGNTGPAREAAEAARALAEAYAWLSAPANPH